MKRNNIIKLSELLIISLFMLFSQQLYGAWVQKANFGGEARHRCTGFAIGNKGYIGGGHINSGTLETYKDYWEYDPSSDCWTQIADFGGGYRYHSTAFSIGNFGYVGLGENHLSEYKNDFWKYIPLINTWVQVASYPGSPRRGASGFVISGLAYVGTGQTDSGYETDFYSYNPETNAWTSIAPFSGEARSSAVAFAHNGKGYLGTGHVFGDDMNDFYEYDPITNVWTQKSNVGVTPRQDATGFVLNGEGYIGTGNDNEGSQNFDDFWRYDFDNDVWVEIDDFGGMGRRYMVSFVIGNVAYCGTGTNGTNLRDFWAFYPLLTAEKLTAESTLVFYPNPAQEFIIVPALNSGTFVHYKIYDLNGNIVASSLINKENKIYTSQLSDGIYFIQLTDSMNRNFTGKISKVTE